METINDMKCRYCGSNLGIEDKVCPYCGRANEQAAGYRAVMQEYRDEYDRTKADAKTRSKTAGRTGRLIVIALMILVIIVLSISISKNSDVDTREKRETAKIAKEVTGKKDEISATLEEMEKNRDYLGMSYYMLNYRLRGDERYEEYARVFTAVINYRVIYEDILNILDGFDGYEEKTDRDWCYDAAIYISDWNSYVGGEFWNDPADSKMHAGEHGAFLADIRQDTQDMVQVYFDLTDDQASSMWDMDRGDLGKMLYSKCRDLYPEEETYE
ncbi:MAG: zinc ribbon domain-containing protein [Lachnospiraceae bacterium]|nr:zinc ribbon domain-containing protein [Lachnospiraceae bacterium]